MSIANAYLDAVVNRSSKGMEPEGFRINWRDAPRKGKFFPGIEQISLDRSVASSAHPVGFELDVLAEMLKATYAEGDRRLAVHANSDVNDLPRYGACSMARGTASGGARYPVQIYWVAGPRSSVTPGVYYYSTYHHALQRLLVGDMTEQVAAALGSSEVHDQYLVLGIKYWQNSFKYHNFCFHAVSMDIGTITESWRSWAAERDLRLTPHLWFDEERVADLVGIDTQEEGLFAIVPLDAPHPASPLGPVVRIRGTRPDVERSRNVRSFPMVTDMQAATTGTAQARPAAQQLAAARVAPMVSGRFVPLTDPEPAAYGVAEALRRRRSSFGRFVATPMRQSALAAMLAESLQAGSFPCDAAGGAPLDLLSLYVFVNHVEGIAPGAYRYDAERNGLVQIVDGPQGAFLQKHYALENYNLEQAGAVIVPAVRGGALIDAVGERGYRLMSAVVGAATQALYQSAAARDGVGCGAALGFDNAAYITRLGLVDDDTIPLIIVLVGSERPGHATYRSEIQ